MAIPMPGPLGQGVVRSPFRCVLATALLLLLLLLPRLCHRVPVHGPLGERAAQQPGARVRV